MLAEAEVQVAALRAKLSGYQGQYAQLKAEAQDSRPSWKPSLRS